MSTGLRNYLFLFVALPIILIAKPAQVIIIRHAEKPLEGEHLSLKGVERSMALSPYFLNTPAVLEFGKPVAIYATNVTVEDKSFRPQETVAPLALALHLDIKHPYIASQYAELAKEILSTKEYEGKMVLICWEHKHIPDLAQALGVNPKPDRWHGKDFDQVWVLTFLPEGNVRFKTFSQELMFGDTSND